MNDGLASDSNEIVALKAKNERLLSECDKLRRELVSHREKAQGNYWAWEGDGEDHVESLLSNCPVLIPAHDLQKILAERDELKKDKERLDWVESQTNHDEWIARQSVSGRGFRLHNTTSDDRRSSARAAIDAAKEGQ